MMNVFQRGTERVQTGQRLRDVLTAERFNALTELAQGSLMGQHLKAGPGTRLRRGPHGTTITMKRQRPQPAVTAPHPWKIIQSDALKVRLIPGSVNGQLPSNWTAELTVPTGADSGCLIWLEATLSAGGAVMSSLEYNLGTTMPVVDLAVFEDNESPGILYRPLGVVYTNDTSITRIDQMERLSYNLTRKTIQMDCATTSYQMEWTT